MTATAHASGEALDGEHLLAQIVGAAPDEDGQLWALHRAIEAAVALPALAVGSARGARKLARVPAPGNNRSVSHADLVP